MNKLIKLVSGLSFLPFLVLTVFTLLTYHQRIGMHFWHDDYTTIYRLQQNIPITFPYQFEAVFVKQLYELFGLEYQPYAILSIILITITTYLVYLLASMLFKNRILSLVSALIFTNGYVGQEETLQLITLGLDTILAMGVFLAAMIFFLKYFKTFGKIWLFLTYIFFSLMLEIGTNRYGTAILIFIIVDWMFLLRAKRKKLLPVILRNLVFISLFALEYVFHLTRLIIQYPLSYERDASLYRIWMLPNLQMQYLGNLIGTFWNILFPRLYQDWLYAFFLKIPTILPGQNLWIPMLPLFVSFVVILILIKLLRKSTISDAKFYRHVLIFLLTSLVWTTAVITTTSYIDNPVSRISITSGGIFLLFLSTLLLMKVPASTFNALFSLVLFSILLTFLYAQKLWYVYDSTQRYLFSVSFAPAFLPAFFITRELYKARNIRAKRLAWLIFLLPTFFLIIFPLLAGIKTQKNFKENYSKHAIRFYTDLERYIPEISSKKAIYIEGATKELNFSALDAVRTGGLPSEAAIAVHYYISMENVILLKEPGDVPKLLERQTDLSLDSVFYFIYNDGGLEDNSKEFRQLLQTKSTPIIVKPHLWQIQPQESLVRTGGKELAKKTTYLKLSGSSLGIHPSAVLRPEEKIKTQLPLLVKLDMKAGLPSIEGESKSGNLLKNGLDEEVEISWDYDSYGRLSVDKKTVLKTPLDGMWHKYEFTIPASGLYLNSLIINYISFPGTIYIGDMQIKHVR